VRIKSGGGHASYTTGRILQAFDPNATTYTGLVDVDRVRGIETGLIKKATLVGMKEIAAENRLPKALGAGGVQLIELKFIKVTFGGSMKTLGWLATAAEELAPTLKVLIVKECNVEGPIPQQVGKLRRLKEITLTKNKGMNGAPLLLTPNRATLLASNVVCALAPGPIPSEIGNCLQLQTIQLFSCTFSGLV